MTRSRFAWIRWSMTLFFALTTSACLIGLAVFTSHQDAAARARVDDQLATQAEQIAGGLGIDENGLVFSSQIPGINLDQALGLRAIGASPAAVIVRNQAEYASPAVNALPSPHIISELAAAAERGTAAFATAASPRGGTARWVAVPVRQADDAVVVLGDRTGPAGEHHTVVTGLAAAVAGFITIATLGGHLLSGVAMRPAIRQTRQQEQFLREAAHELRTPLATISLITEAGLRDPDTASDALRSVHQRLGRVNLLVGSLLARARADAHGAEIERRLLRLDQLIEVIIDDMRPSRHVRVDTEPTIVIGNAELLGQAVRNLVENALRHAPESEVVVTVRRDRVTVEDDGRGAQTPTGDGRAPSALGEDTARRGTGTGLAIVEWVAHMHGASFSFERLLPEGVRASMIFPPAP